MASLDKQLVGRNPDHAKINKFRKEQQQNQQAKNLLENLTQIGFTEVTKNSRIHKLMQRPCLRSC